jgi:hypothetical protein
MGNDGGRWSLFYSGYFKGKAARPVPIAEVQKACQKTNETGSHEN